jgi:hypothetical protein
MVFGKRAFFGYAVHPSGEVWWFANPPRADEPTRRGARRHRHGTVEGDADDLFADDATPAAEIVQATPGKLTAGPPTTSPPSRPGTGAR